MKHLRIPVLVFSFTSSVLAGHGCYGSGEHAFAQDLAVASLFSVCEHMINSTGSDTFDPLSPSRTACRTYPQVDFSNGHPSFNDNTDKAWFFEISIASDNNENGFNMRVSDCVKEFQHAIKKCKHGAFRKVGVWRYSADPEYKQCPLVWSDTITGKVIEADKDDEKAKAAARS
ncbi:hypothetical protein BU16DRAFT_541182 [Lophium mytilinum]|uniref:Ecp2 effector protein domain-containing protein n=1 Tax=Lophium mytilinum TaxID=390894 RepID=A0A6A6QNB8_9PEZI|nr:hypothetical protein BU16DRAFT_541182 [Lophium mytilinum]